MVEIKTYQDLVEAGESEANRMSFVLSVVSNHKSSPEYKVAKDAEEYYARRNVTMNNYRKVLYNVQGKAVTDVFGANYKLTHGFFRRFVVSQVQYVLSNGIAFEDDSVKDKLGDRFDNRISELAKKAMVDGVSFGFWNLDHLEVFGFADTKKTPGFAPLYDADTGMLRAGVRYWEGTDGESSRMTLYEEDGYTEYIKRDNEDMKVYRAKRAYILHKKRSVADEEVRGENYNGFPIIPMYANDLKESEIIGIRPSIDCYDFIKSGMANNVDEASAFYWTLKNTGGMDDMDLQRFVERMHIVKATVLDDGVEAQAHTISVPVDANEKLLDRLRSDLYEDFMLMDPEKALSGNLTATAIRLSYQQQDDKCGDFEYCIRDFLHLLFGIVGIEAEPTFKWNRIANQAEETQMVMTAAPYLDDKAVLDHLPWLTPEEVEELLARRDAESLDRLNGM